MKHPRRFACCLWLWLPVLSQAADPPDAGARLAALDRTIMVRTGGDGKIYGENEIDPLLWSDSKHFLEGESRRRLLAALATVQSLSDAEVRNCPPAQRALVQNRLWTVFDHVAVRGGRRGDGERDLLRALAAAMAKLALDEKEIAAIPDPLVAAAKSARWPVAPRGRERAEIFLPADIATANRTWVALVRATGEVGASNHARAFGGRSCFVLQVRFPADVPKVDEYFRQVAAVPMPWVTQPELRLSTDVPDLPVGTEVALIRRVAVVGRDGRWHATPLTLSVQLRHYWVTARADWAKLPLSAAGALEGQSFAKFELEPDSVARGGFGAMRALGADEKHFMHFFDKGFDQVDGAGRQLPNFKFGPQDVALKSCFQCHSQPGLSSFNTLAFLNRTVPLPQLVTPDEGREAAATASWKMNRMEWGMLQAFWPAISPD